MKFLRHLADCSRRRTVFAELTIALLVAWLVMAATPALAGELEQVFEEGNRAYAEGRFGDAAASYQRLVDHGVREPGVLFNLGDALYRDGRLAEARLSWERAARRAPSDGDLRDNLALVIQRLGLEPLGARSWPERVMDSILGLAGPNGWLAVALAAWIAFHGALAVTWCTARARGARIGIAIAAALTFGCAAPLSWAWHARLARTEGVALIGALPVLAGPASSETSLFTLPLGDKLTIEGAQGEWVHVSLPSGWHGWVPSASIGRIDG